MKDQADKLKSGAVPAAPEVELALEVHNAHLIRRAHQRATVLFQRTMGETGLTPTQLAVLGTLDRAPDLPQNELSRRTAIDAATLSAMLRRLSKSGLVERFPSPQDQRVQLVRLTDEGRTLTRWVVPVSMRLSEALLEPIPESERARFVELLTLVGRDPDTEDEGQEP